MKMKEMTQGQWKGGSGVQKKREEAEEAQGAREAGEKEREATASGRDEQLAPVKRQGDEGKPPGPNSPWKRVALSPRDWELLEWAHVQKFLMFDQVARWFPERDPSPHRASKDKPTAGTLRRRARPGSWYLQERLRKLVGFGVLRRVPVFTEASSALLPGRVGFELLSGASRSHGLPRLDSIDWKNFPHDRAATDIRWIFEKQLEARWKPERVLRHLLGSRQMPDAIVEVNGLSIAVEVELTRKSIDRYMRIIERYLGWTAPRLDNVLYVFPTRTDLEHAFRILLPAVLANTALWGAQRPDLSRFRFTTAAALAERKVWWTKETPSAPSAGVLGA